MRLLVPPTKSTEKRILIKRILAYSAIKIIANITLPYSTLNPETSSDSPSAKSKGVRLVSATEEIKIIAATGIKTRALSHSEFIFEINTKFREKDKNKKNKRARANITS